MASHELQGWARLVENRQRRPGHFVCLNIARPLGGSITVESTPGQGTTFHVTLPAALADLSPGPVG